MNSSTFFRYLFALCLLPSNTFSQEDASTLIELETTPAAKILESEGEKATVRGFVEDTNTNATGIHFLNFRNSEFVCVTFARYLSAFEKGPAEAYLEKWIEVTGEIENYRGSPQIKLLSPDQVKIIDRPAPAKAPELTEEAPSEDPAMADTENAEPDAPEVKAVGDVEMEDIPPGTEVVNGVPALDWRKYFPTASQGDDSENESDTESVR